MAAITNAPLLSVDEYLARFVDGDEKPPCEYIDGFLIPKPMGTKKHSQIQSNLGFLIRSLYCKSMNALPELTTRRREGQFYIPDLVIKELAKPISGRYPGPNEPVLLCVEILSPPDRIGKLFGKCEEYHKWGVPYCWVIDLERKIAWEYVPEDIEPRKVPETITAGPVQLGLDEIFDRV